jgi:hypothetical protein
MPFEYTPTPTNWATATMPSPGDPRIAASVDLPMSQLMDKIEWTRRGAYVVPSSVSGAQNNYTATGWSDATVWRLGLSGDATFNGFDASATVKLKLLVNPSAYVATLAHNAGGQTAGNTNLCPSAANFALGPGDSCYIWHDATSAVWRVITAPRGSNYAWTGVHSFSQSLALSGSAEVNYSPARTRVSVIPLAGNVIGTAWIYNTSGQPVSVSAGTIIIPIRLPRGAVFTGVLAGVTGVDGSNNITLTAHKVTHALDGTSSATVQLGISDAGGETGAETLDVGTFNETVADNVNYFVRLVTTNVAEQIVRWVAAVWADPGPRS